MTGTAGRTTAEMAGRTTAGVEGREAARALDAFLPAGTPVLDPAIRAWLERIVQIGPPAGTSPAEHRKHARMVSDTLFAEFGGADLGGVDRTTHQVPVPGGTLQVEEYRPCAAPGGSPSGLTPEGSAADDVLLPAYLYLHGGGFRLGDLEEQIDVAFCTLRAAQAGYVVYSPHYSLAPEHPHPVALEETVCALTWLLDQAEALGIDPERIVVGGVSAGGALAAGACIAARDAGYRLRGQLLEVPLVDLRPEGPWLAQYATLNGLDAIEAMRQDYLGGADPASPRVSPLLADLRDLPPTHVMTAQFDPLRAGGEAYADRLREAGVRVTGTRHMGALHGTQGLLRDYRDARLWHREVVAVLRDFAEQG